MFSNSNSNTSQPSGSQQQQTPTFNQIPQIPQSLFQQQQNQIPQQAFPNQVPQMQTNQNVFGFSGQPIQQQPLFGQQQQQQLNAFGFPGQPIQQQPLFGQQQQQQSLFVQQQQQPFFPQQQQYQPSLFGVQNNYQQPPQQTIQGDDDEIELKQVVVDQNQQTYDLENNLTFELRSLYKLGKLLDSRPQYLPGMVSVKTKEGQLEPSKQSRAGVDLVCLIDKSGSMQGEKIQMVQQTLNVLLDFLTEKDRLQLITFESYAQRLTPLKKINDTNKQYMKNVISGIYAGGGTTISTATQIAFEQLQNRKQRNNVTSIFILSDGQDGSAEQSIRTQMSNMNEVLTIHSFGFGSDHDAKMMTALCNLGKGSFYFVQNIQLLDEFFADALGGLISVVGTEISVEVNCQPAQPFQDIHLAKTYSKAWVPVSDKRRYKIEIPQISSGSRKDFVFEIGLPKFNLKIDDQHRNSTLVEAKINVKNPINGQVIQKIAQLVVTFFNQDEQIQNNEQDIDVAVQYYRVKATETIEEARKKCDQNQNEEAQKMIEAMIVAIKNNQKVAELCAGILQDLQQAKQGSSKHSYGLFGQQQMCQLVSNNYNQSGTNALFSASGQQMQQAAPQMYQNKCSYNMMQQVQSKKA